MDVKYLKRFYWAALLLSLLPNGLAFWNLYQSRQTRLKADAYFQTALQLRENYRQKNLSVDLYERMENLDAATQQMIDADVTPPSSKQEETCR